MQTPQRAAPRFNREELLRARHALNEVQLLGVEDADLSGERTAEECRPHHIDINILTGIISSLESTVGLRSFSSVRT